MKVLLEIYAGSNHNPNPTKKDIQKNIDALKRAVDGHPQASDFATLMDTISILKGIQNQLPEDSVSASGLADYE